MSYLFDNQNKFKWVDLANKQNDFSMLIILPNDKYGIDDAIKI